MKQKLARKKVRRRTTGRHNLLVPVDFSPGSLRALRHAIDLIGSSSGLLTLLYVVPVEYGLLGIGREESRDLDKALQQQAVARLRLFVSKNVPQTIKGNLEVRVGRPGEEIVAAAKELSCDFIVLSTNGRSGLDRYLIGSVTDRVVRIATCPVFLVPPPGRASAQSPSRFPILRFKLNPKRR